MQASNTSKPLSSQPISSDQSINPHSSTIILDSFPPRAFFNKTWDPVIIPLLKFLHSTNSPFLLNVYPDCVYHHATRLENANNYNSNLIQHVINKTGVVPVATYIYELYNEDTRPGPLSKKNWGLFYTNGTPVYALRLAGGGAVLANDTTNQTFCVAKEKVDKKMPPHPAS
ncbi:unnamed protein product [Brassica oleracea]